METEMKPTLRFEKKEYLTGDFGTESSLPDLLGAVQEEKTDHIREASVEVGFGFKGNSYPYRQQAGYNRELRSTELETAILENDFLLAEFLPTLGGRLWRLLDKTSGRELIYHNDVIRFSNLAVCNAWFSGGVEWNISLIGHSPFTARPLFEQQLTTEDGMPVLRMYEFERVREAAYQMDFWLGAQDRFLNCRMSITNLTDHEIPMYWWSNMAVPEYPEGRIAVPADSAFTGDLETVWKTRIPIVDGTDISEYGHIPFQVDYFFDIPDREHKFIANVDGEGQGLLHLSTDRLQARKLFCWGHDAGAQNWQKFLTEKAGDYVEIQAGIPKTQYGCVRMPANAEWEWLEQYGPVTVPKELVHAPYPEFLGAVKEIVAARWEAHNLSDILAQSRNTALQKGELVMKGSSAGACHNLIADAGGGRKTPAQLDFAERDFQTSVWAKFLMTGELTAQSTEEPPEDFVWEPWLLHQLQKSVLPGGTNEKSWLAWYEIGCRMLAADRDGTALASARIALEQAARLDQSAWTMEALAALALKEKKREEAADWMLRGAQLRKRDIQYLKTAGTILLRSGAFREWLEFYAGLEPDIQRDPRLYFDYITAMAESGERQAAYEILRTTDHMFLDDLRECEGSIEDLWQELHRALFGTDGRIPENLRFISGNAKLKSGASLLKRGTEREFPIPSA